LPSARTWHPSWHEPISPQIIDAIGGQLPPVARDAWRGIKRGTRGSRAPRRAPPPWHQPLIGTQTGPSFGHHAALPTNLPLPPAAGRLENAGTWLHLATVGSATP